MPFSPYYNSMIWIFFTLSFFQKYFLISQAYFMEGVRFEVRTITPKSFESDVIESDDAWILAVKGTKISEQKWQTEENQLRGVASVAFVDLQEEEHFWLEKGLILGKDQPTPVAIVFPYGGEKVKKKKYQHVNSVKEAKHVALSSLSEKKVNWLRNKIEVEQFVKAAYTSWPPRFPLVLTTEKRVTPPLYRALSLKYSRYFNFGIVHSSLVHIAMGLPKGAKIPRMDILISTLTPNDTFNMAALTYEVEKYGPVQYRYLIRFLFSAHEKHWPDLPGSKKFTEKLDYEDYYKDDLKKIFANPVSDKSKSSSEKAKVQNPNIQEITYNNHKKICDDSTPGYCVVAFLDGTPKVFRSQLTVFSQVHNDKQLQEKVLNFIWINATCHPEYGSTFGVDIDSLPSLLIAKPHRRYFVKYSGNFGKDSIIQFIEKSLSGRLNFSPYSRFNDMDQRICSNPSETNETKNGPDIKEYESKDEGKEQQEKFEKNSEEKLGHKSDEDL